MLSIAGIAVLAFAATNLDNLLVLVALISREQQRFPAVVAGTLLATAAMLALCLALALAADLAPQRWLGYLGLVPLGLGVRELLRRGASRAGAPEVAAADLGSLQVAAVMLSNSADSIAALAPLFAETRDVLLPVIAGAVLLASLVGLGIGRWVATHERAGPQLRRLGPRLVPFVLIAVGLYVLSNTWTDTAAP